MNKKKSASLRIQDHSQKTERKIEEKISSAVV